MLELKSCPRCRGDVKTNRDHYGQYRQCLQCGYMEDIQPTVDPYAIIPAKVKAKEAA